MSKSATKELYIGLMSGTSLDAMDAVLVEFSVASPIEYSPIEYSPIEYKVIAELSIPYEASLKSKLHQFNKTDQCSLKELTLLDQEVALLAARAVKDLIHKGKISTPEVKAVAFAGQTIGHNIGTANQHNWTSQCGDPNILAEQVGIPVVADFRRRDVAAGGHGAPLASSFHQAFFSVSDEDRCIVNLGGISNLTILRRGKDATGFDMGPANCLLDEWASAKGQGDYDDKGKWAAGGKVIDDLLAAFLGDPYFSKTPPKTTGRDYFNLQWVQGYLQGMVSSHRPQDVQATLVDLTALSISLAVHSCFDTKDTDKLSLYVAGGGALNDYLLQRMAKLIKFPVNKVEALGVASKQLEPIAFAWLAKQRLAGEAGNIPNITGAKGLRVLGAIYQ